MNEDVKMNENKGMNNFLKITLSIVVGLLLLIGLGVVAVKLLINPNNFKPQIVEAVKAKTGRDLTIDGDLSMTWYPDISIKTGKMTLNNSPEFVANPPLATLNEGDIHVKFLPLLSKNLDVTGIFLQGLTLNLITNQQGVNNWDDLNKSKPTNTPTVKPSAGAAIVAGVANAPQSALINAFSIGNVHLLNTQVNWQDLRTNQTTQLKDLTLSAEHLQFNQAVPLYMSFVTHHSESNNTESIKLSAKVIANEAFDNIQFNELQIQSTSTGDNIPNKSLSSTLNVVQINATPQAVTVKGLQFKAADIALSSDFTANSIKENPSFEGSINIAAFNPNKMLKEFAVPTSPKIEFCNAFVGCGYFAVPVPPETEKLTNFALSTDIKASMASLELQNFMLTLNDTVIKGSVNTAPVITANLDINQLDVDTYFPSVKENKAIPEPSMLLATALAALPAEDLKKLNFRSNVKIGKLKLHGLDLQEVELHTVADKGLITNNQSIKLYQGEYAGKLTVNVRASKPAIAMDDNVKQLQLEPFLTAFKGKAAVRGLLTASLQMYGEGATPEAFKSAMNAHLSLNCENGAIKGVNLKKLLIHGKGLTQNTDIQMVENEETEFNKISGTATINQGILSNNNLVIKTNHAEATGKGKINLNTEAVDYNIVANAEELQGIPLNIAVTGTLSNPKYTLDVSALLNEAKKKLDEANVLEQLKSEENKAKLEHAIEKLKPEEKEKLEKLAPKAKKLLKKLF
ncbi:hypothetical protein DOJK_00119 [Patescibacteria group bacterium]|nr:hypothetical protein DOJK_00119 [Patescibacteria group bacterium]